MHYFLTVPSFYMLCAKNSSKNIFRVLYKRAVSNEVRLMLDQINGRAVRLLAEHQTRTPAVCITYYICQNNNSILEEETIQGPTERVLLK
jgi:hypothetical protein